MTAASIDPPAPVREAGQRDFTAPSPFAPEKIVPVALAFVALALFPLVGDDYYNGLVSKIMIMAIFALSLELLVGQTGLICFGHAAFFGIGAYTVALTTPTDAPASLWFALPLSMGAAALYALPVGALSLRTKGVYFIMITLAFAQMAYFVFHDAPFSGGSDGTYMYFRPDPAIGGWLPFDIESPRNFYNMVLAALVLVFGLLAIMLRSRYGRALA
ncbi:MAG TPA: branched-chain amino acid ABC transporter permease, partial [Burkholderiaceae bacterium]|nr:branched-chain amino acid ABC transporter permease [Burkholderiaceae bacterium]